MTMIVFIITIGLFLFYFFVLSQFLFIYFFFHLINIVIRKNVQFDRNFYYVIKVQKYGSAPNYNFCKII